MRPIRWYTVDEVAERLRVSPQYVRQIIDDPDHPSHLRARVLHSAPSETRSPMRYRSVREDWLEDWERRHTT